MDREVSFGLLGCGRIGERHAECMRAAGHLVAVCDTDRKKADRFGARYGAAVFYNLTQWLDAGPVPDLIAVCTPNGLHAINSIEILERNIHVLCEKPMALKAEDCQRMLASSNRAGRQLFVVKQNRFNPPLLALKNLLDSGKLGRIFSFQVNGFWNRDNSYYKDSWRGTQELDGGTLFTQFSHFIDLIVWLVGEVKSTRAMLANHHHHGIISFEDTGSVLFEMNNGVTGGLAYTVNSHKKNMEGSITLFCENGTVKVGGMYLEKITYQDVEGLTIEADAGNPPNDYGGYQGSMGNHPQVYNNLIRYLRNGEPVYMSAFEGMKTVEIIEKIYAGAEWV